MKTMERTQLDVQSPKGTDRRESTGRRMGIIVLVAVLALILGAVGGYLARGSDDAGDAAIVLAGDGELTARQEQMVDLIADAEAAWQRGDGDALAALFTPTGWATYLGTDVRVDDGSLARYVQSGSFSSVDMQEPMLVVGDTVLAFNEFAGAVYYDVIKFTASDELLMVRHIINR